MQLGNSYMKIQRSKELESEHMSKQKSNLAKGWPQWLYIAHEWPKQATKEIDKAMTLYKKVNSRLLWVMVRVMEWKPGAFVPSNQICINDELQGSR